MELLQEVDPQNAVNQLVEIGRDASSRVGLVTAEQFAPAYRAWADSAESRLRQIVGVARAHEVIHTPQYWHLLSTNLDKRLIVGLFQEELQRRQLEFEEYARVVRDRMDLLAPESKMWATLVLDTNALLDLKVPFSAAWQAAFERVEIRIVIPLRVVEELDKLKYQGRDADVRAAARKAVRDLVASISGHGPDLRIWPSPNVSVEVLVDHYRDRPEHADEEILKTCEDLKQFGCTDLQLVTNDGSMRFQAETRRLNAIALPEQLGHPGP